MYQIFMGSVLLSTIHALIPNHWLPLIAIGKTEKWTVSRTLWATVITGASHTLSTIIIGIVVGLIGYRLSASYDFISGIVAPAILIILGIIYLIFDLRHSHRHHNHSHFENTRDTSKSGQTAWIATLTSLSVAMFLTPCAEIEAYYFQAGTIGWTGIFTVSAVYLAVTLIVMLLLVYLGIRGIATFKSHFLEHHEKRVTGTVLVLLGILAMCVRF